MIREVDTLSLVSGCEAMVALPQCGSGRREQDREMKANLWAARNRGKRWELGLKLFSGVTILDLCTDGCSTYFGDPWFPVCTPADMYNAFRSYGTDL